MIKPVDCYVTDPDHEEALLKRRDDLAELDD
jgi:hypothetical protein